LADAPSYDYSKSRSGYGYNIDWSMLGQLNGALNSAWRFPASTVFPATPVRLFQETETGAAANGFVGIVPMAYSSYVGGSLGKGEAMQVRGISVDIAPQNAADINLASNYVDAWRLARFVTMEFSFKTSLPTNLRSMSRWPAASGMWGTQNATAVQMSNNGAPNWSERRALALDIDIPELVSWWLKLDTDQVVTPAADQVVVVYFMGLRGFVYEGGSN